MRQPILGGEHLPVLPDAEQQSPEEHERRQQQHRLGVASQFHGAMLSGVRLSLSMKRNENTAAEAAEAVRIKRLREDARRPISVNLAEGIALSHQLMRFTGAARRS